MNRDDEAPPLVSLHLPKTAGTSFAAALAGGFAGGYRTDYADLPMQQPRWARRRQALAGARRLRAGGGLRGVRCVHGHFLALKYRLALAGGGARFVTWLRDPVERLASHYQFWRRDYAGDDPAQPLRNRVVAEDWTFERFALGRELRDVYAEYLWGVPLSRFEFVGITERYDEDLEAFARRYLDGGATGVTVAHALANPARGDGRYRIDPGLRRRIEAHHARDVALYRQALARRGGADA